MHDHAQERRSSEGMRTTLCMITPYRPGITPYRPGITPHKPGITPHKTGVTPYNGAQ
ncbi:hypothetical protein Psi02_60260 [Planotetraspora silvatica]|uniref:Uncharacterized protein n=1 Tax=Planotetraspora silvatica TaxID=234614 RepID=A0A8J3UTP7_9ACTN|nr:hypothetical protein Psi02_60260 [Planotetraspora silvatica]